MKLLQLVFILLFVNFIQCHNSESSELNQIDGSPFYDTIIFSDIADVLNELENHVDFPFDEYTNSESQSSEDIEELLSEYQYYLDKTQKQRKSSTDKAKRKNKKPLIHHEKYVKTKPGMGTNYNKYYHKGDYYNKQSFKFPETQYANPINVFIPLNGKNKYLSKYEVTTVLPQDHQENKFDKFTLNEKKIIDLPQIIFKSTYEPNKSSCFCKKNTIPCDCKCKQCISLDSFPGQYTEHTNMYVDKKAFRNPFLSGTSFKGPDYVLEDKTGDNMLNFRIKIDVLMPKTPSGFENILKSVDRGGLLEEDSDYSKAMNLPLPFYNFPIPMDMIGFNKITKFSRYDGKPLHKMTIQMKKNSRPNSNGNKHRKKLITFHNIKLEPQVFTTHFDNIYNISNHKTAMTSLAPNVTDKFETILTTEKPYENQNLKVNHTGDTINLMVNITSNASNKLDVHNKENTIETNYYKKILNLTTNEPIIIKRMKRDISPLHNTATNINTSTLASDLSVLPISMNIFKNKSESNNFTTSQKVLFTDAELLYWPSSNNKTGHSKNITAIILEKENKKAKLNVSKETLRRNHTQALEHAIFGEVNWDDVDTIAPTYMSFVGKYIKGALTFCSETICHSMKCENKNCVHRTCVPEDRINNKGHCAGSNNTDSVVSMESIMDLPSNIAFESVDILHDKMLGKLFGKVTLCIMSKCITFAATKKIFTKSKCSNKDLNTAGHCQNTISKKKL